MKKLSILLVLLLVIALAFSLVGCNGDGGNDDGGNDDGGNDDGGNDDAPAAKKDITGVTISDATYTYDATEKKIEVSGTLPTGVSVSYVNNKATDAGSYNVTATISGEGYNTLTLTATLKIEKAQISGITAEAEQTVDGDGERHLPTYSGVLPSGVTVKYMVDIS